MKSCLKLFIFVFILVASVCVLVSPLARAFESFPKDVLCNGEGGNSAACTADNKNPVSGTEKEGVLIKAANLLSYITGFAAVIAVIIAGFEYVISSGDSAKVEKAKTAIIFAVVGLIIVVSAQFIVHFVIGNL